MKIKLLTILMVLLLSTSAFADRSNWLKIGSSGSVDYYNPGGNLYFHVVLDIPGSRCKATVFIRDIGQFDAFNAYNFVPDPLPFTLADCEKGFELMILS